jgi:uncharacterized OB-fold protein
MSNSPVGAPMPLPEPNVEDRAFWEGCKRGELLLEKCNDCGNLIHPPLPLCPVCQSQSLGWIKSSGKGTVYSFEIVRMSPHSILDAKVPYNVVLVDLAEGPRLVSNLVDCAPEEIEIGMPVEVVFEMVAEDVWLPQFKKAAY